MTGEGDVGGSGGGGIGGLTMNPPMHVGRSMWPRGLMDKASTVGMIMLRCVMLTPSFI